MPGGRPTELNQEVQTQIVERIKDGMPVCYAAQAVGITHQTINNWKRRGQREPESVYGEFFSAIKRAEAELMHECLKAIKAGDKVWQSRSWILERKWPELFALDRDLAKELKQFLKERKRDRDAANAKSA